MLNVSPFLISRHFPTAFLYLRPTTRGLFLRQYSPPLPPSSSFTRSAHKMESESFTFGPYKIDPKEVFYSTQFSYAMVNLRPLLPGHILFHLYFFLLLKRRDVKRFIDLTGDETSDLWLTAQKIGRQLESYHKATSLTLAIQDGPQAGQTVPHVHIHILPRKGGDFEKNDEIYDAIDAKEKDLKEKLDLDKERKDRSMEEMTEEADQYRKLFI
ncbi:bis(5'-adenosyl)-triphosphatase [Salvia divinorum]|uniref:Bis(5'-adenosyl)-triphosphatase n=1 Tax=Salvia divinorum TaxID=28513 RepID=A0ABD1G064_SALDI